MTVSELIRLALVLSVLLFLIRTSNAQEHHAILIGVNEYTELGEKYRLAGSANDLMLMRKILEAIGEFEVTELSTAAGANDPGRAPTRENILREMSALKIKIANNQGGNVVFYFSGHGSQQPVSDLSAKDEADNLDEVILPSDTKKFSGELTAGIPNAITDNEIGAWIRGITGNGGELWAIFDCCHSGDMARGNSKIRYRFIPSEDLGITIESTAIPLEKLEKPATSLGRAAVLYACQAGEKAIEQPISQMDGKTHGLLTYSLFDVLRQNKASRLSHQEIRRRVYESYLGLGRYDGPTPSVEGEQVNSAVFGKELAIPSQFRIKETSPGSASFSVNAGLADGLSDGAFLAVFAAEMPDEPMGFVTVTECSAFASVVEPLAHKKLPAPAADSLNGLTVKFEEVDFDVLKVNVGLDSSLADKVKARDTLAKTLTRLSQDPKSALEFHTDSFSEWLITLENQSIFIYRDGATDKSSWIKIGLFDAAKADNLGKKIQKRIQQIAKGQNLLRILNDRRLNPDNEEPSFEVEIRVFADERAFRNKEGHVFEAGSKLRPGNVIQYSINNMGLDNFDLTVLEVNSRMEISTHFPTGNRTNEIEPSTDGQTLPAVLITDNAFGRVHLAFMAVKSNGQPFDLRRLANSDLEAFRNSGPTSPFKQLLESSVFGSETTRAAPGKLNTHKTLVVPIDILEKE